MLLPSVIDVAVVPPGLPGNCRTLQVAAASPFRAVGLLNRSVSNVMRIIREGTARESFEYVPGNPTERRGRP